MSKRRFRCSRPVGYDSAFTFKYSPRPNTPALQLEDAIPDEEKARRLAVVNEKQRHSLPGLGIVAAVLGVVITMGALGGPPEEIGRKVAAALVGTFLGILLCYGLVGPLAGNMAKSADDEHAYLYVLRVAMAAFIKGTAPIMAVEVARRAIPSHVRPTFQELEGFCRNKADAAPVQAAAA